VRRQRARLRRTRVLTGVSCCRRALRAQEAVEFDTQGRVLVRRKDGQVVDEEGGELGAGGAGGAAGGAEDDPLAFLADLGLVGEERGARGGRVVARTRGGARSAAQVRGGEGAAASSPTAVQGTTRCVCEGTGGVVTSALS
jgi:hypothetical protein